MKKRFSDEQIISILREAEAGVPAIDSTGLKVFGEGEWKVKKHAKNAVVYGESCIWQLTATHMKSSVQTCR
ncbi:ORF1 ISSen4 [Klebsiella pneumoniae]|nr:ORF1 ISSen4 [Klebsiella pneumoniae]